MKWFDNAADTNGASIRIVTTDDDGDGHGYFRTELLRTPEDVRAYLEHIKALAKKAGMEIS
jgi:hypothetical protein